MGLQLCEPHLEIEVGQLAQASQPRYDSQSVLIQIQLLDTPALLQRGPAGGYGKLSAALKAGSRCPACAGFGVAGCRQSNFGDARGTAAPLDTAMQGSWQCDAPLTRLSHPPLPQL